MALLEYFVAVDVITQSKQINIHKVILNKHQKICLNKYKTLKILA